MSSSCEGREGPPLHPLASRAARPEGTVVEVGGVRVGGGDFAIIAGPCAIEDERQIAATARVVAEAGCRIMRGGAFKPRSSPYSFQGLGLEGLRLLRAAADAHGLLVMTEALDSDDFAAVGRLADIVQIGSRSMMSYALLKKAGRLGKPVLLKRNMAARLEEFLLAAEYLMVEGCSQVILCERGVLGFDPQATRNTLDLAAVPLLKLETHLPVVVDPSHGTGRRELVPPMALAALAAGADGVVVEVHPDPDRALCDGRQSLDFEGFRTLVAELRAVETFRKGYRASLRSS